MTATTNQTIREALHAAQNLIPRTEARLLLAHLLQQPITYLIAHDDVLLSVAQAKQYGDWLSRACDDEPIPYIVGTAPFYGRDFQVSPATLIPRPETEQLVELALAFAQSRLLTRFVDVGTGSGCIGTTLACELADQQVAFSATAVDVSAEALAIAKENGTTHGADVTFLQSDLLDGVDGRFDLIAANLPYITVDEFAELDRSVQEYEPTLALVGGVDGLDLVRLLLAQAQSKIAPDGLILLEIGWQQGVSGMAVARDYFPEADVECLTDFAGKDRIIKIALQ